MNKGICINVEFYEAFFKVFLTMKFRMSYPIPLPTHIAGIIGGILGIKRENIEKFFKDIFLGACCIRVKISYENATLIEISEGRRARSVEKCMILNNPSFLIFIHGSRDKVEMIKKAIVNNAFEFLPFGGQNDFFLKKIKYVSNINLINSKEITGGYVDYKLLEKPFENSKIYILPVKFKGKISEFAFLTNGSVKLKEEVISCKYNSYIVPVYKLEDFGYIHH